MKNLLPFISLFLVSLSANAQAEMKFDADTLVANHVFQGDTINAVFYFRNQGPDPLIIHQIWPSCQCTSPEHNKDTIAVGATDSITLSFHSSQTEGAFEKYVIVLCNGPERMLWLKGHVVRTAEAPNVKPKLKTIRSAIPQKE